MAYLEDREFLDEANLIEIPCEFCNDLFPMILIVEHQSVCRPDLARYVEPTVEEVEAEFANLDNNLVFQNSENDKKVDTSINPNWISISDLPATSKSKEKDKIIKNSQSEWEVNKAKIEKSRLSMYIVVIFKIIYALGTSILGVLWFILKIVFKVLTFLWNLETTCNDKFSNDEEDHEQIEKALLQESETFSFGLSNKEKNVEKEKLSFKYPPNPLLNYKGSKQHIPNDLTDSDNEENESLEEFWKRAEVKLSQRLRMLQNKPNLQK